MGLLLKCENVDFGYENQDAVVGVSMEVHTGDYICIVGENGSGKSTLMKGILGLLKPTGGRIEVSDELKRAGIGYLPQQTEAQKDFPATVFEAVLSGCLGKRGNLLNKRAVSENLKHIPQMRKNKTENGFKAHNKIAADKGICGAYQHCKAHDKPKNQLSLWYFMNRVFFYFISHKLNFFP